MSRSRADREKLSFVRPGPDDGLWKRCSQRGVSMSITGAVLGLLLSAVGLAIGWAGPALAEKRVALLVGNNGYENVPRLETAINDARALAETLKALGFKVLVGENQSRRSMSEALLAFDRTIE